MRYDRVNKGHGNTLRRSVARLCPQGPRLLAGFTDGIVGSGNKLGVLDWLHTRHLVRLRNGKRPQDNKGDTIRAGEKYTLTIARMRHHPSPRVISGTGRPWHSVGINVWSHARVEIMYDVERRCGPCPDAIASHSV